MMERMQPGRLVKAPMIAAAGLLASLLAGCVTMASHPAVPPLQSEEVPAPPRTRTVVIWRPGHWDWTGAAYAWAPGEWVERAGHGTLWQDGYWGVAAGTSVWVPAHWL